jgi:hypothetical protein
MTQRLLHDHATKTRHQYLLYHHFNYISPLRQLTVTRTTDNFLLGIFLVLKRSKASSSNYGVLGWVHYDWVKLIRTGPTGDFLQPLGSISGDGIRFVVKHRVWTQLSFILQAGSHNATPHTLVPLLVSYDLKVKTENFSRSTYSV